MNFTKLQAAGNDFVLVETSDNQRDWSQMAVAMCNRHFGIGADGLLLLLPPDKADFKMRIFNADGSEAEACGNGLRCVARYIVDMGLTDTETQEILVETVAGISRVRLHKEEANTTRIQVSMGEPKFKAGDIPVEKEPDKKGILDIKSMLSYPVVIEDSELRLNLVSMGNPHAVYFCQESVSDFPLSPLGSQVEQLSIFPHRINFEVARVLDRQRVEARVWERGVGETLACGTGACAIAVAAQLHGYVDNTVSVKLPGGILDIEWDSKGEVYLSGPAEIVFNGKWLE